MRPSPSGSLLLQTPAPGDDDDDNDDERTSTGARPGPVHLCVILHGLWGSPAHVDYLKESLLRHAASEELRRRPDQAGPDRARLAVYVSESNATSSGHLYDGFDVCAERVVAEIDAEVDRIASEEAGTVEKFSIVG